MLVELQKSPLVQIQLVEEAGVVDVDAALVRLARESGASLITVDHNLALVAEALRVPVAQVNALASTLPHAGHGRRRAAGAPRDARGATPGRRSATSTTGRWSSSRRRPSAIGSQVAARVRNVIQTTTGRMIFATLEATAPATS